MNSGNTTGVFHLFLVKCALACLLAMTTPASALPPLTQSDLDTNRALWESHHISDYDFVLGRSCFCDPTYGLPGLVSVRGGAIVSVLDVQTHEPRNPADFYTVDAFFDSLQHSLDTNSPGDTAEFDPVLGYPRFIQFDDPELFDDDITFGISNLRIVPEPASLAPSLIAVVTLSRMRRTRRCPPRG